jgi:hypothetical protein
MAIQTESRAAPTLQLPGTSWARQPSPGGPPGARAASGNPPQPGLNWPVIAGAGAFCTVFITGLTLAAVLMSRSPVEEKRTRPLPLLTAAPLVSPLDRSPPKTEPDEAIPPLEVTLIDLAPPLPQPPRPESGLEQIAMNAAASVPLTASHSWTPAPPPEPVAALAAATRPPVTCGTSVEFVTNPMLAARQAEQEHQLLFLLHVSGDFEDPGFT